MSISVIIPYKHTTKGNNIELIYALRSLEKNLNGLGEVFMVSENKVALKGLNHTKLKDDKGSHFKERNIYRKILAACNDERVSDNFIVTNDDIYLTQEFNAESLPFYHKGEIINTMAKNSGDYRKSLNHTRKLLMKLEKPTLDYDTHFPILYNKEQFCTFTQKNTNWNQPFSYVIKSLYCNMLGVEGEYGGDCKIQSKMTYEEIVNKIGDKPFFSTSDGCVNEHMIKYLNEKFNKPSKYEK